MQARLSLQSALLYVQLVHAILFDAVPVCGAHLCLITVWGACIIEDYNLVRT